MSITRELAQLIDKETGDVNNLRDKKLADATTQQQSGSASTDSVVMKTTGGDYVEIARDSFVGAIKGVMDGLIKGNSYTTLGANDPIAAFNSNALGGITPANLASVLGGQMFHIHNVEYLQSNGTQWINTNYIPNGNTRVECDYKVTVASYPLSYGVIPFGCRVGFRNKQFAILSPINLVTIHYLCFGDTSTEVRVNLIGVRSTIIFNASAKTVTFNGSDYMFTDTLDVNGLPMGMFGFNTNGTFTPSGGTLQIFNLKIYESDVLVHNFIPRRLGSVGVMYDTITGSMYFNEGSGNFGIGQDV